jgi:hypothetical protein
MFRYIGSALACAFVASACSVSGPEDVDESTGAQRLQYESLEHLALNPPVTSIVRHTTVAGIRTHELDTPSGVFVTVGSGASALKAFYPGQLGTWEVLVITRDEQKRLCAVDPKRDERALCNPDVNTVREFLHAVSKDDNEHAVLNGSLVLVVTRAPLPLPVKAAVTAGAIIVQATAGGVYALHYSLKLRGLMDAVAATNRATPTSEQLQATWSAITSGTGTLSPREYPDSTKGVSVAGDVLDDLQPYIYPGEWTRTDMKRHAGWVRGVVADTFLKYVGSAEWFRALKQSLKSPDGICLAVSLIQPTKQLLDAPGMVPAATAEEATKWCTSSSYIHVTSCAQCGKSKDLAERGAADGAIRALCERATVYVPINCGGNIKGGRSGNWSGTSLAGG